MATDDRSIQVLNISNVNAQGKTVLNDGKLLELIQKYPFLYNRRVKGYNDSDYTNWAWKNINAAFNFSYANDPSAAFSTGCLITRWNALKPLIQCLSKAYDMEAIPLPLRSSVIKICAELDDKTGGTAAKPNIPVQNMLLQNMPAIAELPVDKRLALEREILEGILSAEIETKQTAELSEIDWKEICQDTEEFISDIGYKQVLLAAVSNRDKIFNNGRRKTRRRPRTLGWVPLTSAHNFIKQCHVRIERLNIEDYLPLAQIIEIDKRKNRSINLAGSDTESLGIFGI